MPLTDQPVYAYIISSLLGLLIGLERERKREERGSLFAGVTTFPLVALFGAINASLFVKTHVLLLVASTFVLGTVVALAYWRESSGEKVSGTSHIAVLTTFGLGLVAGFGDYLPALAGAVIVTSILSIRDELRKIVGGLSNTDLLAIVQFSVVSLVVLPLVPNEKLGPWQVWNPKTIWLLVVLISGISFIGYVLSKTLSANKGISISGFVGGIASSTAVTIAFSERSRKNPELSLILVAGVLLASSVAIARLFTILVLISPKLALAVLPPLLGFTLSSGVSAFILFRSSKQKVVSGVAFDNPFELKTALIFALVFALVLMLSKAAQIYWGEQGVYLTSALAGLTQLDAITLTLADQVKSGLQLPAAALSLVIALSANSIFKTVFGLTGGSRRFGKLLGIYLGVAVAVALGGVWVGQLV